MPGQAPQIETVSPSTGQTFAVDPAQDAASSTIPAGNRLPKSKDSKEKKKIPSGPPQSFQEKSKDGH